MAKRKNALAAPVVKWVGGKRQLLPEITARLPKRITNYCEPFLGGGAVLFALQPAHAIVNDLNSELILTYKAIKETPDELIDTLRLYKNDAESFYRARDLDRDRAEFAKLSTVDRAARLLYLNKTCFNGLYRVNAAGEFNTPFGNYKNPNIVNEVGIRAASSFFNAADVSFYSEDFEKTLGRLPGGAGSFAYIDPPYDPVSTTSNFTGYQRGGFGRDEQTRLKMVCDDLTRRHIKFMLSNSATPFILDLYKDYNIHVVKATRAINANAAGRGAVDEVLVCNYKAPADGGVL